jgi:hypothetical protein
VGVSPGFGQELFDACGPQRIACRLAAKGNLRSRWEVAFEAAGISCTARLDKSNEADRRLAVRAIPFPQSFDSNQGEVPSSAYCEYGFTFSSCARRKQKLNYAELRLPQTPCRWLSGMDYEDSIAPDWPKPLGWCRRLSIDTTLIKTESLMLSWI